LNKSNQGTLEIYREYRKWAALRSFAILVDENKVGFVENDASTSILLSPGFHTVMVKMGWKKTNSMSVHIEANKITKLTVGYKKLTGWKLIALSSGYIAMIIAGAIFGLGALIGVGVVGFMFNRFGKMFLYSDNQPVHSVAPESGA